MTNRTEQIAAFTGWLERVAYGAEAELIRVNDEGADAFIELLRQVMPTDPLEQHPGQLRESNVKKQGHSSLEIYVENDAQDAKGNYYGLHVETGHGSQDGKRVPAKPSFYPAWRRIKKVLHQRQQEAINRVIGSAGPGH